jgi:DNA-binding NarL/FixJ family response regulator
VRIVFAEDQALLRVGLSRILADRGYDVIEVDNGPALVAALADPDVEAAVVDVRLPPTHTNEGLAAAIGARTRRPGFPVLVLSAMVEPEYAPKLLADGAGAVGYLLKDRVAHLDQFVAAVQQVAAGGTVLDPEVVAAMLQQPEKTGPLSRLTPREREVLTLMAEGRSNAAIAARMFVTEKAVGKHTNSIFTKLDLPPAPDDNRRVRAVLAWLQGGG